MGRLRKVLVGAVAALATLTAGLVGVGSANAAGSTITLNSPDKTLVPANIKAYKLMGLTPETDSSGNLTGVSPVSVGPAMEKLIAEAIHSAGKTVTSNNPYVDSGSDSSAEIDLLHLASGDQAAITQVAKYLSNHAPATPDATGSGTGTVSTYDLTVPSEGFYLITDSSDGAEPILVATKLSKDGHTFDSLGGVDLGKSDVKESSGSAPSKSYENSDGVTSDANGDGPYVAVGDTAKFTITMTIPNSKSFKKFTLTDTPHGYNINQGSIHVYHVPANTPAANIAGLEDSAHEITGIQPYHGSALPSGASYPNILWSASPASGSTDTGVDDATFTITDRLFTTDPVVDSDGNITSAGTKNDNSIIGKYSGQKLVVVYTATVTKADATNHVDSSTTDYSGKDHDNPGNTTKNGTGAEPLAKLQKVDASDATKYLQASFTIEDITGSTAGHLKHNGYMQKVTTPHAGWKHVSSVTADDTYQTAATADGLDLDGLGQGTYLIKETAAPSGYLPLQEGVTTTDITLSIAADGTVTTSASGTAAGLYHLVDAGSPTKTKWTEVKDGSGNVINYTESVQTGGAGSQHVFSLKNMSNISELPATGGAGIIAGIILVALLLAIGGAFIAISRKMHKDRQQAEGVRA